MKISAIVLAKNEEKDIGRCLDGLKWCDEIIVIDDFSEDKTANIAKDRGAKVHQRKLNNDFSRQRNFGLKKAKNKWVLFVDADEVVSPNLSLEIVRHLKKIKNEKVYGFYLKRKDFFLGKRLNHGEAGNLRLLRLGIKTAGKWEGKVHEKWKIKGRKKSLKNYLFHFSHPSLNEFLKKINFYSSLRAEELKKQKKRTNWLEITIFPLAKFIKNYFFLGGFRDSTAGFIFAVIMSFHSFLTRSKLFLFQFNGKLQKNR